MTNLDLFLLEPLYLGAGSGEAAAEARAAELRRGNLNGDGLTDAADIDRLSAAVREGSTDWLFDLDADGLADKGDIDLLVRDVFETEYADANLDGLVNLADFLILRGSFGGLGGWAEGDFTGDGLVSLADFLVLRTYFGSGTAGGPYPAALPAFIPEPTALMTALIGLTCFGVRRRRPQTFDIPRRRDA